MRRIPPELQVLIPESRVAQRPAAARDASKLLVYGRSRRAVVRIGVFHDVVEVLAGDLLVLNDTRVLPARVRGTKPGGSGMDLLFTGDGSAPDGGAVAGDPNAVLRMTESTPAHLSIPALIMPSRRLRPGMAISLPGSAIYSLRQKTADGRWLGDLSIYGSVDFQAWLNDVGSAPLPPYIRREPDSFDRERYQTVYAQGPGSLAAPTAGLHFTAELIFELQRLGTTFSCLTLNVGLGTFKPIESGDLARHQMESESYHIPQETADRINEGVRSNRPITAVGTTVVRALESAAARGLPLSEKSASADLFIHPPYNFRMVNRLLTNFHRPDSTLIQLVAALIGWDGVNRCYQTALDADFHFYSYGDAMLVI